MFTTILVPLDGSAHAEAVLPWVERLAPVLRAKAVVLNVVNLGQLTPAMSRETIDYFGNVYQQLLDGQTAAAGTYLAHVAERLQTAGCATTTQVEFGDTASVIIDAVGGAPGSTLVAMATHGRTGLARFSLGSIAGRVVRGVQTPVLLVRPLADQPRALDSILVPLDGSTTAEAVLPSVETLALALSARVVLMRATDEKSMRRATYLEEVASRLRQAGVADVSYHQTSGPPAEAILHRAVWEHSSLIAMATHGRSGVRHWMFGSVAEHVLHAATMPLLLVRGQEPPRNTTE
jgi:nucleotide-binding universal stress UspA family protein